MHPAFNLKSRDFAAGHDYVKVAFVLHAFDNVATVIGGAVKPADVVVRRGAGEGALIAPFGIPYRHKFVLQDIATGSEMFKFGSLIGRSTAAFCNGEHIHIYSRESLRDRGALSRERPETPG